jgi:hypothetical protein
MESLLTNNHANLATVRWGDPFEMYATDRSPGNDGGYLKRNCMARRACMRILTQCYHASPGRSLSEDCHKSPRSLPPAESAKSTDLSRASRDSQDAPGIPSSARDHSLALWLTTRFAWKVPQLRGIQTHAPVAHGPISSGAGAPCLFKKAVFKSHDKVIQEVECLRISRNRLHLFQRLDFHFFG